MIRNRLKKLPKTSEVNQTSREKFEKCLGVKEGISKKKLFNCSSKFTEEKSSLIMKNGKFGYSIVRRCPLSSLWLGKKQPIPHWEKN